MFVAAAYQKVCFNGRGEPTLPSMRTESGTPIEPALLILCISLAQVVFAARSPAWEHNVSQGGRGVKRLLGLLHSLGRSVTNMQPGLCVIASSQRAASRANCGVTPQAQNTGTSPGLIVTASP